jgi:hypothetical protein
MNQSGKIISITAARNQIGKVDLPGLPCPISEIATASAPHRTVPSRGLSFGGMRRVAIATSQPIWPFDSSLWKSNSKSSTNVIAITTSEPTLPTRKRLLRSLAADWRKALTVS